MTTTKLHLVSILWTGTMYPAGQCGRRGWSCYPAFSQAVLSDGRKLYLGAASGYAPAIAAARAVGADTSEFEAKASNWVKAGKWELPAPESRVTG